MPKQINRRSFIKGGLAAAGTAAAAPVVLPQAARAAASGGELATMLDLSKCIGCEECVYACKEANHKDQPGDVEKPFPKMFPDKVPVEDWSERREVVDRLTPYNWLYVQAFYIEHQGEVYDVYAPRRCMHCQNPPCANMCPFGAAKKYDNGITVIDKDYCLGGAKCRQVCPWGIPQRQTGLGLYKELLPGLAGNGVMFKCHRCYERVADGGVPACIEVCPVDAQTIGPRAEIMDLARRRAEEINGYTYGEHENGGTNTVYVSPVPFEKLNEAVQSEQKAEIKEKFEKAGLTPGGPGQGQGGRRKRGGPDDKERMRKKRIVRGVKKGRPHFKPVGDAMSTAENMTAAVVMAPIAGAALALGKAKKWFSGPKNDQSNQGGA